MKKSRPTVSEVAADFGARLRKAREDAGYATIKAGAEALGYDEGRYGRWERGEREPDVEAIHKICRVLGVTPDILYGYRGGVEREGTKV